MSVLKKDHFDYCSDDLFGDDDEDFDVPNLENSEPTRNLSFSSQRFEDKRMLYESYMADPTIPPSQKNAMGFWKTLYQPTYSTQKLYKLLEQRNSLPPNKVPNKLKVSKTKAFNEDYGYDGTFFAPTKVLLEEQRRREEIPRAIKDIYEKKGIVSASQIYNIEQNLNCDNDESDTKEIKPSTSGTNKVLVEPRNKELNKSLLELSRTVSEQYEISQIMKDINNISDLDASLTDLTEKIQYSSKAEQIVNHTISCSQRLKILDDIYTANIGINTCDILSDEEESKKSSQESHCEESSKTEQIVNHTISGSQRLEILDDIYTADVSINTCDLLSEESKKRSQGSHCDLIRDIFKSPVNTKVSSKSDINDNIPDNENVPKEVKFSFASGKAINFDKKSIMKFKTIFNNEEKNIQSDENSKDPLLPKNPSQLTSFQFEQVLQQNNENVVKNVGFVFASGKSALISTSKMAAFEKKFKEEEAKSKKLGVEFSSISIELSPQKSKDNKENDGNAQNSPIKPSQEDLKSQKSGEITQKSRTLQRIKSESSALRRTRSKTLLGLKPKRVKFDESVIDKNPEIFSTTDSKIDQKLPQNPDELKQSVPMQIGFSFASGKNIKISDAKLSKFKNIFETEEKNMDMLENVKEPQHVGFTFASGKNIKINSASVVKFKNLFEIEERNMDLLESLKESVPQQQNASNLNSGFVFASGKATNIDRNKLLNFEKKFKEEEEKLEKTDIELKAPECSKISNKVADNKSKSTGSQRKLFGNLLTENQQSSTENEFKSIRNEKPPKTSNSDDIQIDINDISLASQYRSSMDVYRSSSEDEEIKAAKKLLKSITYTKSKSAVTKKLKNHNFGKRSSLGDIKLSDQMTPTRLRKSSHNEDKSLNDEKKQSQSKRLEMQPSTSKCAFMLASGKNVDINQSKINDAKKNFEGDVDENDISIPCQPSNDLSEKSQASKIIEATTSSKSSSKAGNTSIKFHSHRLSSLKAKRKHDDDDSDIFNFEFSTHSLKSKKTSQTSATPIHKAIDSGIESGEKLTNKVESPQMLFKKTAFFAPMFTSSPVVNPPTAKNRPKFLRYNDKRPEDRRIAEEVEEIKRKFRPDVERKEEILDKEFGELVVFKPTAAKRLAMDNDDEIMISPIVKDKKRQRRSYDTPMSSNNFRQFDYFKHQTLSQRIAEVDAFMDLQSQIKLIGNDPTESQVVSILEIEQEHLSRFETENRVKREREEGIKEQIEYVNNKPEDESRQMTGTMFMMKSGSRQNLKDYVGNEQPHDKNIHEWTFDNLLDFKFDMKNYVDEAWSKVSVIVADNAKLIMDELSYVGFNEIKYSFLASYGVDPKLVKHEWLENAYKMIILKFIWMENSFDKFEKFEVLTPENVLLQLKYRYDREIDRHQRPALRKITERDEVPNRRIVLKVIDIIYSLNVGYELELSDGWYKMRTCVDSCLAEAISRKKISKNIKLIICNSELVNMFSSAYHPLELPKGVRLKIHGNSTRIASYDMKLGFCKIPCSFLIPVDCISSDGGIIGRLKLFIIHVYSMIYVESNGERKEFRSEKMQNRLENKKEILYSTMFEKIQKQIMQENYNELKERAEKIKKSSIVLSKMSIHEICDILEYESESDLAYAMKNQMSYTQREKIQEIHHQRKFELNQKVKERINQNENNVAQLLKFRVVDGNNPKKTALVSWWQPSEELLNIIKQGNMIEIFKTSSAGKFQAMCGGEIQIHADKLTVVKLLKKCNEAEKFDKFIRKETRFEDLTLNFSPLNNEFDVACMIVLVDEKIKGEKLQRVYVVDENLNFMSLNFYPSLTDYAYDDVLIEGKILYIRNLQWRRLFKHNNFPEAHAVIDSTIFISNPKDESQIRRLDEFMNRILHVGHYLRKCREKLETFIGKIPSKSNGTIVDIPLNVQTSSSLNASRKRVLGMKRIPQKYRFS